MIPNVLTRQLLARSNNGDGDRRKSTTTPVFLLRDIRRWLDLNHFGAAAIAPAAALPSSRDGHTAERYAELVRLPADASSHGALR